MAVVDGQEVIKQGRKGCFDLALAFKTYHEIILKVSLCLFSSCSEDMLVKSRPTTVLVKSYPPPYW